MTETIIDHAGPVIDYAANNGANPYDPYGPGASVSDYVGDEVIDD